jgi:hypothetical protein
MGPNQSEKTDLSMHESRVFRGRTYSQRPLMETQRPTRFYYPEVVVRSKRHYLKLIKEQHYIDSIKNLKTCEGNLQNVTQTKPVKVNLNSESKSSSESGGNTENNLSDSQLCKICYTSEYNVVFVPCYHIIACGKCASSVTRCPACRKPFESIKRVYFS